jgi:hypothetical protein
MLTKEEIATIQTTIANQEEKIEAHYWETAQKLLKEEFKNKNEQLALMADNGNKAKALLLLREARNMLYTSI